MPASRIVKVEVSRRGPQGAIDPQDRARFDRAVEVAEAVDAVVETVTQAEGTAVQASEAAQQAAQTAAQDAAAAVAPAAADAIRAQVAADADRAAQAAEALPEEVAERKSLIAPEQDEAYIHRFLARSSTVSRLRYLLGGFRSSDGAFEAAKVVARSFGGTVSSRWVDRIMSSRGDVTLMAFDHRGRARFQPDEATLQFMATNMPPVEGVATDYPLVTTATATFYRPMGSIIGIHAYGQSWEARNGHDAPPLNDVNGYPLLGARFPRNVLTLNDAKGFLGWEGASGRTNATGFVAAQETDPEVQTPVGAMAFRMGKVASDEGRPQVIVARTEAKGNTAIEYLMPSDMAGFLGDGALWSAWEGAITNAHAAAQSLGLTYAVRFIPWTHGAANEDDSYSAYKGKVVALLDRMSARARQITGQTVPPQFLVVQHPSGAAKGYSHTFKVIADLCRERADCTLVAAGYGHDMIDPIHWNRWAAAEIGELRAIAADMHLRGLPWGGPMLSNPQRSGRTVTFDVIGAHDVVADESIVSDRHQINGTYDAATGAYTGGIPVPFYGFEASLNGAAASIASVTVERRKITVMLASDPAPGTLQIRYAMHNNGTVASSRPDGRGANRGNIRADWQAQSLLNPARTLRRWLASDYFDITI